MDQNSRCTSNQSSVARRSVLQASAWGSAAVAVAVSAPATAASVPPSGEADLTIQLLDPTVDPRTWAYVEDQPVYAYGSTAVRFRAAAPAAMVLTNNGTEMAINPTGTLDAIMWNYDFNARSASVNYTLVSSSAPEVQFSPSRRPVRSWTWTYAGSIAPGQTVSIPLRYEVGSALGTIFTAAFSQYRYNLFMSASVVHPITGEATDVSERDAYFGGTHNLQPEF